MEKVNYDDDKIREINQWNINLWILKDDENEETVKPELYSIPDDEMYFYYAYLLSQNTMEYWKLLNECELSEIIKLLTYLKKKNGFKPNYKDYIRYIPDSDWI